ncbi:hypothetical protein G6F40_016619 [Rhizopus arrhizus]|nr:hypothetical protein G6F40_016619 [Rhizopus arrhizus]
MRLAVEDDVFIDLVGHQQHAGAARAGGQQLLAHVGDGADVQAPGGLVGHDEARLRVRTSSEAARTSNCLAREAAYALPARARIRP